MSCRSAICPAVLDANLRSMCGLVNQKTRVGSWIRRQLNAIWRLFPELKMLKRWSCPRSPTLKRSRLVLADQGSCLTRDSPGLRLPCVVWMVHTNVSGLRCMKHHETLTADGSTWWYLDTRNIPRILRKVSRRKHWTQYLHISETEVHAALWAASNRDAGDIDILLCVETKNLHLIAIVTNCLCQ